MDTAVEDVVIVGAGIAGLATALGLHRKGIKSLVLESSSELRASGFAFTTWANAWRAMDALGVGESLRQQSLRLQWVTSTSASSGSLSSKLDLTTQGKCGEHEVRCLKRNLLLEALEKELPSGTIKYSSKIVLIDELVDEYGIKIVHLADGSIIKTKVLVGCDGVNSLVAKWLGFGKLPFSGRSATRGFCFYPNGHELKAEFSQYFGKGFRLGVLPCDDNGVYWFFAWTTSAQDKEVESDAKRMREFVSNKIRSSKIPKEIAEMVEKSEMGSVVSSPLKYRWPLELIWANISKGNTCVAGDSLHAMTPDLGQGGCSALEDAVVLARCLGDALGSGRKGDTERIKDCLDKYAKERRWRSFDLVVSSYLLGVVQGSSSWGLNFLRDRVLSGIMAKQYLKKADFDCGKL